MPTSRTQGTISTSWNPPATMSNYIREQGYKSAGGHTGQASGVASFPQHVDTHDMAIAYLWSTQVGALPEGQKLTFRMDQLYESAPANGATWTPIASSQFRIERTVSMTKGKVKYEMKKTGSGVNAIAKPVTL